MPIYEHTRLALGPLRTNLLTLAIALRNDCGYCAYGSGAAVELLFLRDRGELFPLDEPALLALAGAPPGQLHARLSELLREAGLAAETPWLDRLFELADGAEPAGRDDRRLAHLIKMFAVLNSCAIASGVTPDEAHDPINRAGSLKRRYAQLRRATR